MKRFKLGMAMMVVLSAFLLMGSGILQAEDGVTNDEILIGSTMDLSGPLAFMGQSWKDGAMAYFRYINDNGGIHGRKIKFLVEDDGFQSPRTVQAAKKLVIKDKVFCMSMNMGAAGIFAILPFLEQQKVPMLPAGTANELLTIPARKYVFVADTSYRLCGIVAVKYLRDTLKAKHPRFAVIYQDDVTGTQWLTGVKEGAAKYYNIKGIPELSYKRGAIDFSAQVAKCKQDGATHIFIHGNVREPAAILKEAERLQYKATFFANGASQMDKTVELCGDALSYSSGFYAASYGIDPVVDDNEGIRKFRHVVKTYNIGNAENTMNAWGCNAAMILCEVLNRAGKDLTREGFIKAAETIKDFDTGMLSPITWRSDKRQGGDAVRMFKADRARVKFMPISGWLYQ